MAVTEVELLRTGVAEESKSILNKTIATYKNEITEQQPHPLLQIALVGQTIFCCMIIISDS